MEKKRIKKRGQSECGWDSARPALTFSNQQREQMIYKRTVYPVVTARSRAFLGSLWLQSGSRAINRSKEQLVLFTGGLQSHKSNETDSNKT